MNGQKHRKQEGGALHEGTEAMEEAMVHARKLKVIFERIGSALAGGTQLEAIRHIENGVMNLMSNLEDRFAGKNVQRSKEHLIGEDVGAHLRKWEMRRMSLISGGPCSRRS